MSNQLIQIHGGIGMTDEFDAGLYLKRARVLETTFVIKPTTEIGTRHCWASKPLVAQKSQGNRHACKCGLLTSTLSIPALQRMAHVQ